MPSQPLGTRAKAVFKRLDIDLRNAGLLLYSDGLVEAMKSRAWTMFGYDNVTAAAGQLRRETGREVSTPTCWRRCSRGSRRTIGAGSYNDDVTLVVIMPRD